MSPRWIVASQIHVHLRDRIQTPPQSRNAAPLCEEALGGGLEVSESEAYIFKSHFISYQTWEPCILGGVTYPDLIYEDEALRKWCGEKLLYCLCICTCTVVCACYLLRMHDVRLKTFEWKQFTGHSSKDVAQCRLHLINVEIKPTASVVVCPDFILGCIGRVYNKGKFNRLLCQSGAEGWKGFLTPAKPLRTPGSKGLWAREVGARA